ncbi:arginine decarboxylase [Sphingobacterium zeae]|uniref:Arginine decarboxylase n=1 Tax=Sphingobacterium zeae TaxID=1776859 RepID=A0ABU0U734_9SPHI|nr:arginine decarboxylase [Sphingobacterium zeae]MDQ1150785.1 arginine decarboxylase [Sphingobacterium zeae]
MKEHLKPQKDIELSPEFNVKDGRLFYRDIDLFRLAKEYGTPLRFTFLPSITDQIKAMDNFFTTVIAQTGYRGTYTYYYCTKSSHFRHVLKKAMELNIGIEISSEYDIALIEALMREGSITTRIKVICNGYKTPRYQDGIISLIEMGSCNVLPIIDSKSELQHYINNLSHLKEIQIGIRLNLSFLHFYPHESRFGLSPQDIRTLFNTAIKTNNFLKFTTLHFFNEKGMAENDSYWDVLEEVVKFYCEMRRVNCDLTTLDIGGGMPFRNNPGTNFDIILFVHRIVTTIQYVCRQEGVPEPDIITEFGKYTVSEATTTIFKIHEKKRGTLINWAIIDGSFITHLPDTWAIRQEYPVLPINNLDQEQSPFVLGGLTCDSADIYPNSEKREFINLPNGDAEQFIAFFHTGAYQEALSGFGGVSHCMIPDPKHILIDKDNDGNLAIKVFSERQKSKNLLRILGYQ